MVYCHVYIVVSFVVIVVWEKSIFTSDGKLKLLVMCHLLELTGFEKVPRPRKKINKKNDVDSICLGFLSYLGGFL